MSLDAYVSNFKHDNSDRVRELVATIVTMFSPRDVSIREVIRGEKIFSEKLNPSVSLQIAAGVLRYQHSSEIQRIEVFQTPSFGRLLRLDEHTQFSEFDEFIYHESIVHPALVTHERPTDVLILGGGDGGAAEEVLKHYSINTLTVVEIDRKVVEVAKRFFPDMQNGAFDSDKIQLVYC